MSYGPGPLPGDAPRPPGQDWSGSTPPPPHGSGTPYPPYGYTPYGYGGPVMQHPSGTSILVLGILSLVVCGILGPIAWSMGSTAVREMDAQPTLTWTNRGNVTAGRICGIIGTCLLALQIIWILVIIGVFASLG